VFCLSRFSFFVQQMVAYLKVLAMRYKRDPCPYHNKRVMILYPWFMTYLVTEYRQFKIKTKRFTFKNTAYELWVNGTAGEVLTWMKWVIDVDHLYLIHQTGGNHWVTLHVNLLRSHIDCYDCIVGEHTLESELKILEACRPFTRIIPAEEQETGPAKQSSWGLRRFHV